MSGEYLIPLSGLKDGCYSYDFEVGPDFFSGYEGSVINDCNLALVVVLERHAGSFALVFKLKGTIQVVCDRCLDEYSQRIDSVNSIVVKYGLVYDDSDPDLMIIPAGHHELDLRQLIYDYAHLALPIKRVHPDDESGNSGCDPEMLARISTAGDRAAGDSSGLERLKDLLYDN